MLNLPSCCHDAVLWRLYCPLRSVSEQAALEKKNVLLIYVKFPENFGTAYVPNILKYSWWQSQTPMRTSCGFQNFTTPRAAWIFIGDSRLFCLTFPACAPCLLQHRSPFAWVSIHSWCSFDFFHKFLPFWRQKCVGRLLGNQSKSYLYYSTAINWCSVAQWEVQQRREDKNGT